jgi:hypothetical protein
VSQNFYYKDQDPNYALMGLYVQYGTGGGFAGDVLAPVVNVASPNFKVPTYKAAKLDDDINAALAPRDGANEISSYLPTFSDKSAKRYGLKAGITREVQLAGSSPLSSIEAVGADLVGKLRLGSEKRIKALLDGNGNAASAPSVKWDATSGTIIIEKNIDNAREAFVKKTGFEANKIVIPSMVAKPMKRDATIRELRKYTDPSLIVNGDLPSTLWGLDVIIPGALQNTANPGATQVVDRVWNTDTVYLLYVDPSIGASGATMTALAQFRWGQWGMPFGAYSWADPDPTVKVNWVAAEVFQTEAVVCADAIYRIPDVLT